MKSGNPVTQTSCGIAAVVSINPASNTASND